MPNDAAISCENPREMCFKKTGPPCGVPFQPKASGLVAAYAMSCGVVYTVDTDDLDPPSAAIRINRIRLHPVVGYVWPDIDLLVVVEVLMTDDSICRVDEFRLENLQRIIAQSMAEIPEQVED